MWQELVSVLKRIMSVYRELLALSKQKKAVIISAEIKGLEEIVKREQLLINVIGKLERERASVLSSLLTQYNLQDGDLEFRALVKFCDESTAKILLALQEEIKVVFTELNGYNKSNMSLIEKALEFVNFNINILSQAEVGPTYGVAQSEAAPPPVTNRTIFDQKI